MFILQSDGTSPERALTLGDESTSDWTNVTIQELGSTPPDNQLWTLEESITKERFVTHNNYIVIGFLPTHLSLPPIVLARIQSVAKPALSLSLGGDMILPRLYLGVVAVPNKKESDSQRWRLGYTSIE